MRRYSPEKTLSNENAPSADIGRGSCSCPPGPADASSTWIVSKPLIVASSRSSTRMRPRMENPRAIGSTRFSISDPETSTAAWAAGREKTNAPKRSATLTEVVFGVIGASTFGSIVAESQYEPGGISRNSKFPFVGFVTVDLEKLEKTPGWRGPSLTRYNRCEARTKSAARSAPGSTAITDALSGSAVPGYNVGG